MEAGAIEDLEDHNNGNFNELDEMKTSMRFNTEKIGKGQQQLPSSQNNPDTNKGNTSPTNSGKNDEQNLLEFNDPKGGHSYKTSITGPLVDEQTKLLEVAGK